MNISINSRTVRTLAATTALGLAFLAGTVTGRADTTVPTRANTIGASRTATAEHVYYVVD
jgi:hypothetical protein